MSPKPPVDINAIFEDGSLIDEAMNEARQAAIRHHQQSNVDLVFWQDGKIVLVDPKSLPTPPPVDDAR